MLEVTLKLLPDIDLEKCTGCGKCVEACIENCLKLINDDFAVLIRANMCGSDGRCVDPCFDDAIHMEWIEMIGDNNIGRWKTVRWS